MALISDTELLLMSLATEALNGIAAGARDNAREAASAVVRSALVKKYAGAEATFSGMWEVKDCVAALAAHRLLSFRGVSNRDPTKLIVDERNKLALEWLQAIVDGDRELAGLEPTKGAPLVGRGRAPRWTRDALSPAYDLCAHTGIDLGDGES